jgi:hypothetical protein
MVVAPKPAAPGKLGVRPYGASSPDAADACMAAIIAARREAKRDVITQDSYKTP